MSISYTVTKAINDGASTISKSVAISAVGAESVSFSSTGATTNKELDLNFTRTQLLAAYFSADAACTLTFNASTNAGTFQVALAAGVPKEWELNTSLVNATTAFPAGDVTKCYLTAATTCNLEIRAPRNAP
jgi:hypothetical protein